jgi:uncharacterized repeat protein (TIGR01451 family)
LGDITLPKILVILGASLVFSLPAYSASNTDVQWVARWLDDGAGNPATQAAVQGASPKRFFAAGDDCTLLDENNTTGTFGPYSAGNECVLGEGPGRGQDADWDHLIRLNIQTVDPACNINARLKFKVGNFELDVDWEYCEFLPQGGVNDELLYSFPVPQRSAFADGVESVEVFIPNNTTQRIGWWRFPPPPPPAQCSEVTDWQAAADTPEWTCTHEGTTYEYADFHILTTDGTDVCAARATYLPTAEGDNQGLFCSQTDTNKLRAIFNWNNGSRNKTLSWLVDVEQIGSRTKADVACGVDGETVAGRCANQLNAGKRAFNKMVGSGGTGIRDLDTSNLDSFEQMFFRAKEFDQSLSGWNTADVTTIAQMFQEAGNFTNGGDPGINNWDTRKVTKMNGAFDRAVSFNHDLSGWDTSEVTDMSSMFYGASSFNGSVSSWNTSKAINMRAIFQSAVAFNRDLSHFDVALVTDMSNMFKSASVFNQDISAWTTVRVINMTSMFESAKVFNRDLSAWNVLGISTQPSNFSKSATKWTGTDPATNQPWCNKGQPRWGTDGTGLCLSDLNFDVSSEPMALVETGESVRFTVTFSNESENDVQGATLKFSLPSGTAFNEAATPIPPSTNANGQLTWTGITVPKASAGGALVVTLDVPSSYTNSNLVANFVMEVSNLSVTATQSLQVVPGGEPAFAATLDAPNYALAGTELTYQLSVSNIGTRDAGNATVTLIWDQTDLVPESNGGNCAGSPLTCSWSVSLAAEDEGGWDTDLTVTVPSTAEFGDVMDAQLTVSDAGSDATDSALATTTVNSRPDLVLVMTSSPRRVVAPGGEVGMTMALKNVGTAPAKNVVLTLPTSTASFASATNNGSADGDNVVWPPITTLAASDTSTTYTATLTAGADDSVIQTQASLAGTTEGGSSVSDTSNLITLRVTNEADPVLTAAFDPENFVPGQDIALTFDIENEGSAQLSSGTLVVPLPRDTSLATAPTSTGASCTEAACTIPVDALAAGGSATASVSLIVDAGSSLTRLGGAGALKPNTVGAFQFQAATAEADVQVTSDTKEPFEISITPPAGSGCSLTSVSTQKDTGVTGFTLVRDQLLNFSITGCDPGTSVPVAITVQGDALPAGTIAIKTDDSGASGSQISGATISGNTLSYTLIDNGPLDLDTDLGELRDPVSAAIAGGSGIYVPFFIPVPIPYWVLGLLTALMGWLGYRRLRLA